MEKEKELLRLIEDDARITDRELATMLGVSETHVKELIKKLLKKGVIRKFKAIVDWKKAGVEKISAMIQVKVVPQERAGFASICREISKDSRVQDLFVATGEYDLIVWVEAASMDEISSFITDKLAPKKYVVGTYTHIILSKFKRNGVTFFDDEVKRLLVSP